MTNVSIIGAGKLGTSLGYALSKKGFRIKALSCRTFSSVKESRKIIREGKAFTDNVQTARYGEMVVLSVPDDEIENIVDELLSSDIEWSKKFVFHCSGLLSSEILKPLKIKGALTASVHPIQSFAKKKPALKAFKGIYFGLEGSRQALALSQKIVRKLGGHYCILKAKDKPLYHTACSIASNFFVILLDMAVSLFEQIGFEKELALQTLLPLVQGTLHNVKKFNIPSSLTGPVIRGDYKSITKHFKALEDFPPYYEAYLKLTAQALEIIKKEKKLSPEKIKALKILLEEK